MRPLYKTVRIWAAIIFGFALFINGMMATLMFWFGTVPQSWVAGLFMIIGTAATISTFATYTIMINPDWWKNREDLESERLECRKKLADIEKLRMRYVNKFEIE